MNMQKYEFYSVEANLLKKKEIENVK